MKKIGLLLAFLIVFISGHFAQCDTIAPSIVHIDSVSFQGDSIINIGWQASSPDVKWYYIYKNSSLIDSVPSGQLSYQYVLAVSDPKILSFSTQAVDTCGNINSPGPAQSSFQCVINEVSLCDSNKTISIKWNHYNPASFSGIRSYWIYRSVNGGPYSLIDSVLPVDSGYTDNTVLSNSVYDYKVSARISSINSGVYSCLDSINSSGINLVVNVIYSGNKVAAHWSDHYSYFNGTYGTGWYKFWQIYSGDTTLMRSGYATYDSIRIYFCYPSQVNYFVTLEDTTRANSCVVKSNISGGTVGDNIAPVPIFPDSVSFDTGNTVQVGWSTNDSSISELYLLKGKGQYPVMVKMMNAGVTTAEYIPNPSDTAAYTFSIAARDTCGNLSVAGPKQSGIVLKVDSFKCCDSNNAYISLRWNKYNPQWSGGVTNSDIYRNVDSTGWMMIDSVSPIATSYLDTDVEEGKYYQYRLRSWETGKTRGAWSRWDSLTFKEAIIIPGISEEHLGEIKIYPNPSKGEFYLESDDQLNGELIVYNTLGNEVYRQILSGKRKESIDPQHLPAGMYIATFISEHEVLLNNYRLLITDN